MKHPSTIAIFNEWQRLAFNAGQGGFAVPARASIEPRKLARHLADLFIVESVTDSAGTTFRIAGTRICTLYGRELRASPLSSLWPDRDRPALNEMIDTVNRLGIPALSMHQGITVSSRCVSLELLLAPLTKNDGQICLLGCLVALDQQAGAAFDPVVVNHLQAIEPLAPDLLLNLAKPVKAVPSVKFTRRAPRQNTATALAREPVERPRLRIITGGKA